VKLRDFSYEEICRPLKLWKPGTVKSRDIQGAGKSFARFAVRDGNIPDEFSSEKAEGRCEGVNELRRIYRSS
jgi:hypothetical protein